MSERMVLRGEPGVGESALLGYAMEHAADLQIVRTAAVESEMTLVSPPSTNCWSPSWPP